MYNRNVTIEPSERANLHSRENCDVLILNCYLITLERFIRCSDVWNIPVAAVEASFVLINKYRDFNHCRCLIPFVPPYNKERIKIPQAYTRCHYPCDIWFKVARGNEYPIGVYAVTGGFVITGALRSRLIGPGLVPPSYRHAFPFFPSSLLRSFLLYAFFSTAPGGLDPSIRFLIIASCIQISIINSRSHSM